MNRIPILLRRLPAVLICFGAWIGALAGIRLLDFLHWGMPLCGLRLMTGIPCPTCGGTRALLAFSRLQFGRAFAFNPLATLACVGLCIWLALWLIQSWLNCNWTSGVWRWAQTRAALLLLGAVAVANWVYLIFWLPR